MNRFKNFIRTFTDEKGEAVFQVGGGEYGDVMNIGMNKSKTNPAGEDSRDVQGEQEQLRGELPLTPPSPDPPLHPTHFLTPHPSPLTLPQVDYNILASECQTLAYFLPEAPKEVLEIFDEAAKQVR